MSDERVRCPVCRRMVLARNMAKHHVVPKSRGGRGIELVCRTCHRQIHALFSNRQLAQLETLAELRRDPAMREFLRWVAGQNPDRYLRAKTSRRRQR